MLEEMAIQWNPGHLIITTTFFGRLAKMTILFLEKKPFLYGHLVIMANFFGPIGDRISGGPLYMHLEPETVL